MVGINERLTPVEFSSIEFPRSMRGYDVRQVDNFLRQLEEDYTALFKENADLREENSRLQEQLGQYLRLEATLKNTLVVAEKAAEDLKQAAAQEAELKRKEAELEAKKILDAAARQVQAAQEELAELQRKAELFRAELRSYLQTHLELLEQCEKKTSPITSIAVNEEARAEIESGLAEAAGTKE